ncbi:ER lumen protein retaining receptor-domain-containing protein [Roridomyces roridus]|uniref:ER lumen protein retaining receptor-domain-containing protein n=1 Tax=Roridomyces roridus TaxID=1738132 RepID=A0AAD7B503_9AGAR|nr:ER lumen protein retaining receptor-domain-containing protein [Roridomyces roridus]
MNPFRAAGDCVHFASKCILIWSIHRNNSAEGISLLTQAMYALVFIMRYIDLFFRWVSLYNFAMKIIYIASAVYVLVLMSFLYTRTPESPMAWRAATISVVLSAIWGLSFNYHFSVTEILWSSSIFLESTCILPQLILIRQTTIPTVITSHYLLTLGSYRFLYILNWGWRYHFDNVLDPIALSCGIAQTAFYVDFAWVYYTRQRVKLRGGLVVDLEDYERGWLTRWLAGGGKDELELGWRPLEATRDNDEEAAVWWNCTPDWRGFRRIRRTCNNVPRVCQ